MALPMTRDQPTDRGAASSSTAPLPTHTDGVERDDDGSDDPDGLPSDELEDAIAAFEHEKRRRGKIRKRTRDEIEVLKEEYRRATPKLAFTSFVFDHGGRSGHYRTTIFGRNKTYEPLDLYSFSLHDATVAAKLADRVMLAYHRKRHKEAYHELLQAFDENVGLGLPGDAEWVPPDPVVLGFTPLSLEEQQDALAQIDGVKSWKPRNTATRYAGDLCKCRRCDKVFRWDTSNKRRNGHRPISTACPHCDSIEQRDLRLRSWSNKVAHMIGTSKSSSKNRNNKRQKDGTRRVMAPSECTREQFRHKLETLQFRCYYTSSLPHGGLWLHTSTISIERLNEKLGYTENNWQPIHIAFQAMSRQWTREKVLAIPGLRKTTSLPLTSKDYEDAREWCKYIDEQRQSETKVRRGDYMIKQVYTRSLDPVSSRCNKPVFVKRCDEQSGSTYPSTVKAAEYLGVSKSWVTQKCRREPPNNRINDYEVMFVRSRSNNQAVLHASVEAAADYLGGTPSGVRVAISRPMNYKNHEVWYAGATRRDESGMPWLYKYARGLWFSAKSSTKSRNAKRDACSKSHLPTVSLTEFDILRMLQNQGARCAYLDVPLSFESGADWQASLERIDRDAGYCISNCVIVCMEVNTGEFQWSRGFAEQVWPVET